MHRTVSAAEIIVKNCTLDDDRWNCRGQTSKVPPYRCSLSFSTLRCHEKRDRYGEITKERLGDLLVKAVSNSSHTKHSKCKDKPVLGGGKVRLLPHWTNCSHEDRFNLPN